MLRKEFIAEEMKEHSEEIKKYSNCMREIKLRMTLIQERCLQGTNEQNKLIDTEIICQQFKCIIELILLSTFVAHKKYYEKNLEEVKHLWRLSNFIKILKSKNPNFYPVPVGVKIENTDKENTQVLFAPSEPGFLTLNEALEIYDTCTNYTHPRNPFAENNDYLVWGKFKEWFHKINILLTRHIIAMFNSNKGIFVSIEFRPCEPDKEVLIMYLAVEGTEEFGVVAHVQ